MSSGNHRPKGVGKDEAQARFASSWPSLCAVRLCLWLCSAFLLPPSPALGAHLDGNSASRTWPSGD